jgi:mannose-6-phosphate isomerase-like protein (cupin superfamily)
MERRFQKEAGRDRGGQLVADDNPDPPVANPAAVRPAWLKRQSACGGGKGSTMKKINGPTIIPAAGNMPKIIEEYVGRVNTGTTAISIARMMSPAGWMEPGQTPEFDEYTIVLKGVLHIDTSDASMDIHAGEGVLIKAGEWVRYGSPRADGAEYIAVCLPAFSPVTVHRDES